MVCAGDCDEQEIIFIIHGQNNRYPSYEEIAGVWQKKLWWVFLAMITPTAGMSSTRGVAVAPVDTASEAVVLLHGLWRSSYSLKKMENYLTGLGYHVYNLDYPSTRGDIASLSQHLAAQLENCCLQRHRKIHFVTHSLGGILVRAYLKKYPLPALGHVVMLSPPNQGSELVDVFRDNQWFKALLGPAVIELGTHSQDMPQQLGKVDYSVGVITGNVSVNPFLAQFFTTSNDGKVAVERAKVSGMADFYVVPRSHTFIMNSPQVWEQVQHFLKYGMFDRG